MLSFIIPTYNCARYLDETVGSVISQLSEDFELILVDDGSDDGTAEKLTEYQDLPGKNVKILLHDHQGVSAARNAGINAASGEWVSFMDCDDCLIPGFFNKCRNIIDDYADLYIFSFESVECTPESDKEEGCPDANPSVETVLPLTVADRVYESSSAFADEYVRTRHLLVYSACNKFYKKTLLDKYDIRFRDGLEFGEDRLLNYEYLRIAGRIATSSLKMFRYMQRNPESASKRTFPDYYNTIMMLHKAKMDCFLELSQGTSADEKRAFIGYDISTEIKRMIDRFDQYPEEKSRNLPLINKLIFGEEKEITGAFDILIVLGSSNCGYRAERAFEIGKCYPDTVYIVTGGNMHRSSSCTEAVFMAELLKSKGISESRIKVESEAVNTLQNLTLSAEIIESIRPALPDPRIGIVTAAFHVNRTRDILDCIAWFDGKDVTVIPAYGRHTSPDNWYDNPYGRKICLSELSKRFKYSEYHV